MRSKQWRSVGGTSNAAPLWTAPSVRAGSMDSLSPMQSMRTPRPADLYRWRRLVIALSWIASALLECSDDAIMAEGILTTLLGGSDVHWSCQVHEPVLRPPSRCFPAGHWDYPDRVGHSLLCPPDPGHSGCLLPRDCGGFRYVGPSGDRGQEASPGPAEAAKGRLGTTQHHPEGPRVGYPGYPTSDGVRHPRVSITRACPSGTYQWLGVCPQLG